MIFILWQLRTVVKMVKEKVISTCGRGHYVMQSVMLRHELVN